LTDGLGSGVQIVGEFEGAGEGVIGPGGFRSESDGFACFASGAWRIVRLDKR
jgi:hypothetical protein